MTTPNEDQVAGWWRTLREHESHGRCRPWADAFAELVAADRYLPTTTRPQPAAGDQKETPMQKLTFVRPNRCDNSGPNCVEVAIDADGSRIVRNSQEPATQVRFSESEWTAFVESVRADQPL